ncbi:hypothetical protein V6Z98_005601 [Aspergillus fumigatus]
MRGKRCLSPESLVLPADSSPKIASHGGVEEIKDTLQCLVGFDPRLIQTLTACCFSGIEHIPPSVLSLWTDSTSSPPRVLSASGCWPSGQPGFQETWSATTRLARKDIRVYERGELKGDPTAAYCQLAQPDHRNPIYIIGAMPAALIARYPFHVSEEFFETATPFLEQQVSFNVTPTFSVVQIHIDYGMEGLSVPLGDCEKIWFMWPPTERNLSLMANESGQLAKLIRLAPLLEGGILLQTDSDHALTIPSGCLHATLTIKGGFLVTKDFATRYTIQSFSRYLAWGLQQELDENSRANCYYLYLDCLNVALENGEVNLAIEGWVGIERILKDIATKDATWRGSAWTYWEPFLNSPHKICMTKCSCGFVAADGGFLEHFKNAHLYFLGRDKPSRTRRCSRRKA